MTGHSWWGTISVVIGLLLCLLLVISPLFIPQVARAAPAGVTVNRYYTTWEAEVSTTNTAWTEPESSPGSGFYPLRLTFTPPASKDYLIIACATLSNSSTDYTTSWHLMENGTELASRDFKPTTVGDYVPFGWHDVIPLTADTEYTFKMQFKTSDVNGVEAAKMRHARIIAFQLSGSQGSDYHHVDAESTGNSTGETTYDLPETTEATLSITTPPSSEDYLVLASCDLTIDSAKQAMYTRLTRFNGSIDESQGEVCRQLSAASQWRSYLIMRVMTFSSSTSETLKVQYHSSGAQKMASIKNARITAVKLSELGVDVNKAEAEAESPNNTAGWVEKVSLASFSPSQYGDYLIMGFCLLKSQKTNSDVSARLNIDESSYAERAFQPEAASDYIPLYSFKKYRTSPPPDSHTVKIEFKSADTNNYAYCKNARILAIKVNTLESYSDAGVTPCTTFDSINHTVNIYGYDYQYDWGVPAVMPYKVVYYDGGAANDGVDGAQVVADAVNSNQNRSISSTCECNSYPSSSYGTWHAVVYRAKTDDADPATTYTANDSNSTMEVAFNVDQSAIPEFPTVIAGIVVAGMCAAIYWWMRRRLAYVRVSS